MTTRENDLLLQFMGQGWGIPCRLNSGVSKFRGTPAVDYGSGGRPRPWGVTKTLYRLKRFRRTNRLGKCHRYHLKRFLRTSHPKFVMS